MPKRRTSRYAIRVPSSSSSTARSWLAGSYRNPPVIRRWTSSTCPPASRTTRYLPAPLDRVDALAGQLRCDPRRLVRPRQTRIVDPSPPRSAAPRAGPRAARARSRPREAPALADRVEHDWPLRAAARRRARTPPAPRPRPRPRTPRRARAPRRAPPRARPRRPASSGRRRPTAWSIASSFVRRPAPRWRAAWPTAIAPSRPDDAAAGSGHLADDRSPRKRVEVGIAALRLDPPLVGRQRRAVGDGFLGHAAGGRTRRGRGPRARAGARPSRGRAPRSRAALRPDRRDRLADLERVPDRLPERLVHVRQHADDLSVRAVAELDHRLGQRRGRRRSSS